MSERQEKNGILVKAIAGFYYVEAGDGIFVCKARGTMRKNHESPMVGDQLAFEVLSDLNGVITKILPRKNSLVRPPVANVDRLFIVSSHNTPSPNPLEIDRLTVIAEENDIEPIILFNKCDLGNLEHWRDSYQKAGFTSFVLSTQTGEGCDEVKKLFEGKISILTGNSGVGKSSILNTIFPELDLKTGEVSEKLGRGRHTTRHVELFSVKGGYVADTPGFSSLDLEKAMHVNKENLAYAFRDFREIIGQCQFTSCSHTGEKGCALKSAVDRGEIGETRYMSYLSLYHEVKDFKEWEQKGK